MNKHLFVLLILLISGTGIGQDDFKPWERLGLSQTEWKLIQENNIPVSKVEKLLKDGISIGEYIEKPWEGLEMKESKWAQKRRAGMTSYDIELEAKSKGQEWNGGVKEGFRSEIGTVSGSGEAFSSLLPGYQQLKAHRKASGIIMLSVAGGSLIWCTAGSIANKRFEGIPVVCVLVPDMVWSLIDFKIFKKKSRS